MDGTMEQHQSRRGRYASALILSCSVCVQGEAGFPPQQRPFGISHVTALRRQNLTPRECLLTPKCQLPTKGREATIDSRGRIYHRCCNIIPRGGASKQSDQSNRTSDSSSAPSTTTSRPPTSESTTYFVSSHKAKGARPYMEDEFIVSNGGKFAAVFDGHGGSAVSRYLRQNLYASLQAALPAAAAAEAIEIIEGEDVPAETNKVKDNNDEIGKGQGKKSAIPTTPTVTAAVNALQTAFEKVDAEINRISHWSYQGSTAVAVMIHEGTVDEDGLPQRTLISANVGDSRAILCKRDGNVVQLTRDHKPNDVIERNRIEASCGSVDWCGMSDADGNPIEGTGVYRINGNLAVARAIGDRAEKPCVSSEVEISTYDISGDRTGDIILLASDGLWDVMENEAVAEFVRQKLQEVVLGAPGAADEGESVALEAKQLRVQWGKVAELVVDEALKRGSTDNVSVVIIMIG